MNGIEIIDLEDPDEIHPVHESKPSGIIDNQQSKSTKVDELDNLLTANKYIISDLDDDESDPGFCEIVGLSNLRSVVSKIKTVNIPSSPTSCTALSSQKIFRKIPQDSIGERDHCNNSASSNKTATSGLEIMQDKPRNLSVNVTFRTPELKAAPDTSFSSSKMLKLSNTSNTESEVIELLDDSEKLKFQNERRNDFSDDVIIIDENYIATKKESISNLDGISTENVVGKHNKLFEELASEFAKQIPSSPDTIHQISSGITDVFSSPVLPIKPLENKNLTDKLRAITKSKAKKNSTKPSLHSATRNCISNLNDTEKSHKDITDQPNLLSDSSIQYSSDGIVMETGEELNSKPKSIANSSVSLDGYTESSLDLMLQEARLKNPSGLKKANQVTSTKEALTKKMICCFSTSLDKELRNLNQCYPEFLQPLDFSTFESNLPVIKLQRKVDSVYHQAKMTYIPIPLHLEDEDVILLCYDSKDLPKLLQEHDMMNAIKKLREEKSDYKIVIFLNEYEKFLRKLNSDIQKDFKQQVSQRLQGEEQEGPIKKRRKTNENGRIQPDKVVNKLIGYEIKYGVHFFPHDGLCQLFEWLIPMAYTTSSRYTDNLERNINHSNIGKVKSGIDPTACFMQMLNQIKGMTDIKAKKFVQESKYNSVGKLFNRLKNGSRLNDEYKLIRNDIEKAMRVVFLSNDENELIN